MKKGIIFLFLSAITLFSCTKEDVPETVAGVKLSITTSLSDTNTKTSYSQGGTGLGMTVDWEATESITVVSFNDSGITAVDEFTSSGEAGRQKAVFSGTWTGNADDKVICLYPSITTSAGSTLYQNVTVGQSQITFNYPAHGAFTDIALMKNWDAMIGEVSIDGGGDAHVSLSHQTAVIRLVLDGGYRDSDGYDKVTELGLTAYSGETPVLFADQGTLDVTKSTYTGIISPSSYQVDFRAALSPELRSSNVAYYYPVFANGTLHSGDMFKVNVRCTQRWGTSRADWWNTYIEKTLTEDFSIEPGKIYDFFIYAFRTIQ